MLAIIVVKSRLNGYTSTVKIQNVILHVRHKGLFYASFFWQWTKKNVPQEVGLKVFLDMDSRDRYTYVFFLRSKNLEKKIDYKIHLGTFIYYGIKN